MAPSQDRRQRPTVASPGPRTRPRTAPRSPRRHPAAMPARCSHRSMKSPARASSRPRRSASSVAGTPITGATSSAPGTSGEPWWRRRLSHTSQVGRFPRGPERDRPRHPGGAEHRRPGGRGEDPPRFGHEVVARDRPAEFAHQPGADLCHALAVQHERVRVGGAAERGDDRVGPGERGEGIVQHDPLVHTGLPKDLADPALEHRAEQVHEAAPARPDRAIRAGLAGRSGSGDRRGVDMPGARGRMGASSCAGSGSSATVGAGGGRCGSCRPASAACAVDIGSGTPS